MFFVILCYFFMLLGDDAPIVPEQLGKEDTGNHWELKVAVRRGSYLQLPCHRHHLVIGGVVLVAVGKHQSHVGCKFLSISVFPVLQFRLERKGEKGTFSY